jgi:hypothetical protein
MGVIRASYSPHLLNAKGPALVIAQGQPFEVGVKIQLRSEEWDELDVPLDRMKHCLPFG